MAFATDDEWAEALSWLPWLDETTDREDFDDDVDRLGGFRTAIAERIRAKYMILLDRPSSFTLPGEYGESRDQQLTHLASVLHEADSLAAGESGGGWVTSPLVRRGRPDSRRP